MAKKIILRGRVQGVFCRAYCSDYARSMHIHGSATNSPDGTVRLLLGTDDEDLIRRYIDALRNNPRDVSFYGRIDSVEIFDYSGPITGDYRF